MGILETSTMTAQGCNGRAFSSATDVAVCVALRAANFQDENSVGLFARQARRQ
jgi:hypothetical protein